MIKEAKMTRKMKMIFYLLYAAVAIFGTLGIVALSRQCERSECGLGKGGLSDAEAYCRCAEGLMAQQGSRRPKYIAAQRYFEKSCELKYFPACEKLNEMGERYYDGDEWVVKNRRHAGELFAKACAKEAPRACYHLGACYQAGDCGLAPDPARGQELLQKACAQRVAEACLPPAAKP